MRERPVVRYGSRTLFTSGLIALCLGCSAGGEGSGSSERPSSAAECAGEWGSVPCSRQEGVGFQFLRETDACEFYDLYYRNRESGLVCLHPASPVMFGRCGGGGVIAAQNLGKWPNRPAYDILVAKPGVWPPFGQWEVTVEDPCAVKTLNINNPPP